MKENKLKVGIYGINVHQIWDYLEGYRLVEFIAVAAVPKEKLIVYSAYKSGELICCDTLEEMLERVGEKLDLVCLCSPVRAKQWEDAVKCLRRGISVYAEKPAALNEDELDRILLEEREAKKIYPSVEFHEIADTAFFEPYMTMRHIIAEGVIGEIVQIYAQKSYPNNYDNRPDDENIDGGITRQVGIHAVRFIEHVCGERVSEIITAETNIGAPEGRKLITASSLIMKLEKGGVASVCLNYCNPETFGLWGNESLRAFGTKGVAEITDGGRNTHLWTKEKDYGAFCERDAKCKPFFEILAEHLLFGSPMPFDSETELHPLRVVIRAYENKIWDK